MTLHKNHRDFHQERPERVMAIYLNLINKQLLKDLIEIDADPSPDLKDLELCHTTSHIKNVEGSSKNPKTDESLKFKENIRHFGEDNYQNMHTRDASFISAGATIEVVRAVVESQTVDTAFAIVRPPGHHAGCSSIAGFCFFNNAAIAARVAQKRFGKKRVCIFDWDVHYGDGTSEIFYNDPSVLYISIHRFDMGKFYPGPTGKHEKIGEGAGKGYNVQFPFNVQANQKEIIGDKDYIFACEQVFFTIMRDFKPDLIIISAGFDSALGDPLGEIGVSPVGYAYMTWAMRQICPQLVVVLEGGYNLKALEVSSEAVVRTLQINPNDSTKFDQLLETLSEKPGLTFSQLETLS